jgi:alpha-tubulin suppressor-like RCC1 family protein
MSQEKAQLIAPQGHFTVPGLNVAGVVTASSFSGNCTGTASSLTQGSNVVVGVMTASSFAGDVFGNAAGLSTTTAGLKLGIVTSTSFAGNFTGIGSGLTGTPNIVAGLVTASQFIGNTPGLAAGLSAGKNLAAGIITATTFHGDGSGLTGAGSTAYIRQTVQATDSTTTINLNNGNIIYYEGAADTTVSFANTSTAEDVTIVRSLASTFDVAYNESISTGGITFDNAGDDERLTLAATADFHFGTDDFTIEAFVNRDADTNAYPRICNFGPYYSSNDSIGLQFDDSDYANKITFFSYRNASQGTVPSNGRILVSNSSVTTGTWYHVAVTRTSGTFRLFINGVLEDTNSSIPTRDLEDSATNTLAIAGTVDRMVSEPFDGKVSNFRIINGTSLYTKTFLPPSAELANVTNTKLLCCQSTSSATASVVTPGTITADNSPTAGAQTVTYSGTNALDLGSITWPDSITWNGGSAPTLLGANSYSLAGQVFNLVTYNGGTNWYGYEEVNNTNTTTSGGEFSLYGWGQNQSGELGVNSVVHHSSPIQIPGTTWTTLAHTTGDSGHNTVIKSDGTLWVFGNAPFGQLGQNDRTKYSSPVQVPGTTWTTSGAGDRYTMATKSDGTLWVWGYNLNGRLGLNNLTNYSSPVQIPGTTWGTGPYQLAPLSTSGSAIKTDGTLWMWGRNNNGNLGINDATDYSSPKQVPGTTWRSIGGSFGAVLATKTDNTLWAWGYGGEGQLAQNSVVQYSSPVQIPGTTWGEVTSYGGWGTVSVIKTDGTLWNWGNNDNGSAAQNNTNDGYSSPVQVPGTTWKQCDRGDNGGVVAVKTDGTLWSWGKNHAGQGGRNDAIDRSSPVQIPGTTWHSVNLNTSTAFALKS